MKRFEGKSVVITGAASGIGEATARRLAAEGAKIVIADYAKDKADRLAQALSETGADVRPVYFTAAELDSCRELISFARETYGRIDCLVNNVGGSDLRRDKDIETLDIDYFDEVFHINLRSAVYLTQLAVQTMSRQGGGNIVNIASIGGLTGDYQGTFYGMSKAGIISLTQYTATQAGKKRIRCNAVAPGLVLTPAALNNLPEDRRAIFLRHNALPYLGEPENIAATVAFLASDDAAYITGQTIVADGGMTAHNPTVADILRLSDR